MIRYAKFRNHKGQFVWIGLRQNTIMSRYENPPFSFRGILERTYKLYLKIKYAW